MMTEKKTAGAKKRKKISTMEKKTKKGKRGQGLAATSTLRGHKIDR